jgi:hypothetical protein
VEKKRKPIAECLSRSVQIMLKKHEFNVFNRIRQELRYPTNAAYGRMILLREIEKKKQTELL